jgi:RNase P/RNase MRP subunit POP5
MGLLRVSRAHCQMVSSALILITSIARSETEQNRDKVSFSVVALCGTIRNCQLKAIEHDKALINSFYSQKSIEAKALMESSVMEIENALATT